MAIALRRSAGMGLINVSFLAHFGAEETRESAKAPAALQVQDNRELCRCANNQIRAAFAFSVHVTQRILAATVEDTPVSGDDAGLRDACWVFRLLFQTWDANPMTPVWVCPAEYRRRFSVEAADFGLDARELDGREVAWSDFGGLQRYLDLLAYCAEVVAENEARELRPEASNNGPPGEIGNWVEALTADVAAPGDIYAPGAIPGKVSGGGVVAPDRAAGIPKQAPVPVKPVVRAKAARMDAGLVSEFVAERCLVGDGEMVLAAELFNAYLDWCGEKGSEPVAQRRFGMYLTGAGLERRRRGRGKHWWMGLGLREAPATVS